MTDHLPAQRWAPYAQWQKEVLRRPLTREELGEQAINYLRAMLDARLIKDESFPVYAPAIRKLVAEYESAT